MKYAQQVPLCIAAAALLAALTASVPAVAMKSVAPAPASIAKSFSRRHCDQCGVVASTLHVDASGDQPAYYEFVVRMRDGSTRTSRVANLYKWRDGDHVMIGGGDLAAP